MTVTVSSLVFPWFTDTSSSTVSVSIACLSLSAFSSLLISFLLDQWCFGHLSENQSSRDTLVKTGCLAKPVSTSLDHLDCNNPRARAGILNQKVVCIYKDWKPIAWLPEATGPDWVSGAEVLGSSARVGSYGEKNSLPLLKFFL